MATILKFGVDNFKSSYEHGGSELWMTPLKTIIGLDANIIDVGHGYKALKHGIIFGADCVGKSNFLSAIKYMHDMVIAGSINKFRENNAVDNRFCGYNVNDNIGSFWIEFVDDEKEYVYHYGFSINYDTEEFDQEYLDRCPVEIMANYNAKEIESKGFPENVFHRTYDKGKWNVSSDLYDREEDNNEYWVKIKRNFSSKRKSKTLILSEIHENYFNMIDLFKGSLDVYYCISSINFYIGDKLDSPYFYSMVMKDERFKRSLLDGLQYFDTGITDVQQINVPRLTDREYIDPTEDAMLQQKYGIVYYEIAEDSTYGWTFAFKKKTHPTKLYTIPELGSSIKKIIDLCALIHMSKYHDNNVYVMDNIGYGLDQRVTRAFMVAWKSINEKKSNQLICVTDATLLMDEYFYRMDEVWFIDISNYTQTDTPSVFSSELYSLASFKDFIEEHYCSEPSKRVSCEQMYRYGRFTNKPFFNHYLSYDGNRLMEKTNFFKTEEDDSL